MTISGIEKAAIHEECGALLHDPGCITPYQLHIFNFASKISPESFPKSPALKKFRKPQNEKDDAIATFNKVAVYLFFFLTHMGASL